VTLRALVPECWRQAEPFPHPSLAEGATLIGAAPLSRDNSGHRLAGLILLSLLLHGLLLALPGWRLQGSAAPTAARLHVDLVVPAPPAPRPTQALPVTATARPTMERLATARPSPIPRAEVSLASPSPAATTAAATIDLAAALATARAQARAVPGAPSQAGPPTITVEAAIARAIRSDSLVETRGAGGERVTIQGRFRCVTPLVVPHFMEGKTVLTQCEAIKG